MMRQRTEHREDTGIPCLPDQVPGIGSCPEGPRGESIRGMLPDEVG